HESENRGGAEVDSRRRDRGAEEGSGVAGRPTRPPVDYVHRTLRGTLRTACRLLPIERHRAASVQIRKLVSGHAISDNGRPQRQPWYSAAAMIRDASMTTASRLALVAFVSVAICASPVRAQDGDITASSRASTTTWPRS